MILRYAPGSILLISDSIMAAAARIVRGKFQNGNIRTHKILLIANVLIGGDKEIELPGGQR